jgi:hypothetical protein
LNCLFGTFVTAIWLVLATSTLNLMMRHAMYIKNLLNKKQQLWQQNGQL